MCNYSIPGEELLLPYHYICENQTPVEEGKSMSVSNHRYFSLKSSKSRCRCHSNILHGNILDDGRRIGSCKPRAQWGPSIWGVEVSTGFCHAQPAQSTSPSSPIHTLWFSASSLRSLPALDN